MVRSAMHAQRTTVRSTNRFDSSIPGESRWHTHRGGQFILVESGISHLRTEFGAWIIPARRVGWVPPGVRHSSRTSGRGRGWVILSPLGFSSSLLREVCVLQVSALMSAALDRLTRLGANEASARSLLWRVVAAELRYARPEPLEVPMPNTPRILRAAQIVLAAPTIAVDLDQLSGRAGMSRRSFTRHFRSETGLTFSRWKRAVSSSVPPSHRNPPPIEKIAPARIAMPSTITIPTRTA